MGDAALRRHGGGLHLEPHGAGSVQRPQGVDDPAARLIPDAEHSARGLALRLLLQDGEGRALLQHSRLGERRQPDHVVIGRDAGGQREQLVLQQQGGSSRRAVAVAGPVAGSGWEGERVTARFSIGAAGGDAMATLLTPGFFLSGRKADKECRGTGSLRGC